MKEQLLNMCLFTVEHRWYTVFLLCNVKGVCDESVWLKSRTEHVNWTNLFTLSCSASDFNQTLSSETLAIEQASPVIKMHAIDT